MGEKQTQWSVVPGAIQLTGTITEVYKNSGPDWSAGELKTTGGEAVKFAGQVFATQGRSLTLLGNWRKDTTWGEQFHVKDTLCELGINLAGLSLYLAQNPKFRGIGPKIAQDIVQHAGTDFERLLLENPAELLDIKRLTEKHLETMARVWQKNHPRNVIRTWLHSYGLTHSQVEQLTFEFGNDCLLALKQDPFDLLGKDGLGFSFNLIDKIARKLEFPHDHPSRLKAALKHQVSRELNNGHCWTEKDALLASTKTFLATSGSRPGSQPGSQPKNPDQTEISLAQLDEALSAQCALLDDRQKLVSEELRTGNSSNSGNITAVGLPDIREKEDDLAKLFKHANLHNPLSAANLKTATGQVTKDSDLNAKQIEAIKTALSHGLSLISGVAGSGKTRVISDIYRICIRAGLKVALTAPTGKAAKRMEEVIAEVAGPLGKSKIGSRAAPEADSDTSEDEDQTPKTIHRLLKWDSIDFNIGRNSPLEADVVIVDEFSMVDVPLAWHLFEAINPTTTAVILVGDHQQLPPVGPGNILRDLINSKALPTVILTDVMRQEDELPNKCAEILEGTVGTSTPPDSDGTIAWSVNPSLSDKQELRDYLVELFETRLDARGFDILKDVQVLTPQRKGPLGTRSLNRLLQATIQKKLWGVELEFEEPVNPAEPANPDAPSNTTEPTAAFLKGDKVIQTRNNYNLGANGIMNGTIGYITDRDARGKLSIKFDGESEPVVIKPKSPERDDLDLAYALTIHKAQGSEFPCVVLVIHSDHHYMHHRNLFYTGVTRAKTTAVTLGDEWGMDNCAAKKQADNRRTYLSHLL